MILNRLCDIITPRNLAADDISMRVIHAESESGLPIKAGHSSSAIKEVTAFRYLNAINGMKPPSCHLITLFNLLCISVASSDLKNESSAGLGLLNVEVRKCFKYRKEAEECGEGYILANTRTGGGEQKISCYDNSKNGANLRTNRGLGRKSSDDHDFQRTDLTILAESD